MKPKKKQTPIRMSLEISEAVRDRMERVRSTTDAASLTEVIRRALAVYESLIEATIEGGEVVVRESGAKGRERVVMLVP